MDVALKSFLQLTYSELEALNLEAKNKRRARVDVDSLREYYLNYLKTQTEIKAVTVGFTDLEGRFHMLDYDKKYFINNYDGLTFDGSSVRGFTRQAESDLNLRIDWGAWWWLPSDVFGGGKVLVMGIIEDHNGLGYEMDMRSVLKRYLQRLYQQKGYQVDAANEVEGFLVAGEDAEKTFDEKRGFSLVSSGGYYHSLPNAVLRNFIDLTAEAQRAMGFENEKDHPEVAPSQFELNYSYTDALIAADQIQIYKLICRQIAHNLGLTATFLPKPVMGINGSGMHTNVSISKNGKNLFYSPTGRGRLSSFAWDFVERVLSSASDICLILNASVNSYRRLDPHFEAPNEIKVSEVDRGAMIRIPLHTEKSARVEVRSVGPDANPYFAMYALIKTGLEGPVAKRDTKKRERVRFLPSTIQTSIAQFRVSNWTDKAFGTQVKRRYLDLKQTAADRCPAALGNKVKNPEVLYHHEVYNQMLWNDF